ncbi:hypothetical protein PYCCODRAFT_1358174 [Trametes coccinea BRFM310]|uniref:Uncharacterized protein n=1 Tax=Trametes coccinea (strain BRFM310) TaxID=1353009 RepID=A0A1Y2J5R4_TRAC3|nr:hypothetical protein PYCCODRAFT_1358174 [Trametes coccinea BRFM310]
MLIYVCALFVLATVTLCLQTWINHDAFILHLAFPGGPAEYLEQNARSPANLAMTFMFIVLNWLADGMLLFRCYVVFGCAKSAMIGCCLAQLALVVIGCVFLKDISMLSINLWVDVKRAPSLAYLSCSLVINTGLTLVIIIRLIHLRSRISDVLGSRYTRVYFSLVAMLVESAAPYTVVALIAIIACAKRSPLQIAMLPMLGQLQAIPPLLIAFRVMEGRALTHETWKSTLSFVAPGAATAPISLEPAKIEPFLAKLEAFPRDEQPPSYATDTQWEHSADDDVYTALPNTRRSSRLAMPPLRLNTDFESCADWKISFDEESSPTKSSTLSLPQYPSEAHTPQCTTCPCSWPRPV